MKYPRVLALRQLSTQERRRLLVWWVLVTAGFVIWIWASEPLSDLGVLLFIGWLGLVSSRGQKARSARSSTREFAKVHGLLVPAPVFEIDRPDPRHSGVCEPFEAGEYGFQCFGNSAATGSNLATTCNSLYAD